MKVLVVGLSHHRTPVEIRERVAYSGAELPEVLPRLKKAVDAECLLLSTCNRTEVYAAADSTAVEAIRKFIEADRGVDGLAERLYAAEGTEAVVHAFRVASGLDSMVVGESEILGQVKRAYLEAVRAGTTGPMLNRLFQAALHTGKSVRSSTSIGSVRLSVPGVAVSLAQRVFGDLSPRVAMIVGAGETGRLTAEAFRTAGVTRFTVLNRSAERARALAEKIGAEFGDLGALGERLPACDLVVSCVFAERPLLGQREFREAAARRRGRPMLVVDLSVPRSVDPAVDRLEHVFLYNIDDLEGIVAENAARRAAEIERCEQIVRREVEKLVASATVHDSREVILKLRERYEAVAREELMRLQEEAADLSPEQTAAVEAMLRRLVNKLLDRPVRSLRDHREGRRRAELLRRLFQLE